MGTLIYIVLWIIIGLGLVIFLGWFIACGTQQNDQPRTDPIPERHKQTLRRRLIPGWWRFFPAKDYTRPEYERRRFPRRKNNGTPPS